MTEQDTPKMTHDEMIDVLKGLVFGTFDRTTAKEREALDMAISALKGLDLPDNATNEDALNYMLRQTFPKVIFIHFHNEANLTEGVVMAKEWLSKPYKKGE